MRFYMFLIFVLSMQSSKLMAEDLNNSIQIIDPNHDSITSTNTGIKDVPPSPDRCFNILKMYDLVQNVCDSIVSSSYSGHCYKNANHAVKNNLSVHQIVANACRFSLNDDNYLGDVRASLKCFQEAARLHPEDLVFKRFEAECTQWSPAYKSDCMYKILSENPN